MRHSTTFSVIGFCEERSGMKENKTHIKWNKEEFRTLKKPVFWAQYVTDSFPEGPVLGFWMV